MLKLIVDETPIIMVVDLKGIQYKNLHESKQNSPPRTYQYNYRSKKSLY